MANKFGTDILIQAPDPEAAAAFYVNQLGFGCDIVKDEPDFPRCYVRDPFGLIYNLTH